VPSKCARDVGTLGGHTRAGIDGVYCLRAEPLPPGPPLGIRYPPDQSSSRQRNHPMRDEQAAARCLDPCPIPPHPRHATDAPSPLRRPGPGHEASRDVVYEGPGSERRTDR
jgi:hypothetical protein